MFNFLVLLLMVSLCGVTFLLFKQKRELAKLTKELDKVKAELEHYKSNELITDLGKIPPASHQVNRTH